MMIMCENIGGLLHRSDEIHVPISLPFLGYFGLHLSNIRLISTRQQGKLLLSLLDAVHSSLITDSPGYSPMIV